MYVLQLDRLCPSRSETLRYLGHDGQDISGDLDCSISKCIGMIGRTARPRCVYDVFDVCQRDNGVLLGGSLLLRSLDVKRLLRDCKKAVLFAATLGGAIDNEIRLAQELDPAKAVILNAAAAALIEQQCDSIEAKLKKQLNAQSITRRFSCGYGDLPLEKQPELLRALDAQRKIGLSVSDGGIMLPKKSVTAIFGICDGADLSGSDADLCKIKCTQCQKTDCVFRRG
ncbi:MAG: methionine synthase [Clostridia bacterium]|nr:methionine synthase [Clostridia bacterium]